MTGPPRSNAPSSPRHARLAAAPLADIATPHFSQSSSFAAFLTFFVETFWTFVAFLTFVFTGGGSKSHRNNQAAGTLSRSQSGTPPPPPPSPPPPPPPYHHHHHDHLDHYCNDLHHHIVIIMCKVLSTKVPCVYNMWKFLSAESRHHCCHSLLDRYLPIE